MGLFGKDGGKKTIRGQVCGVDDPIGIVAIVGPSVLQTTDEACRVACRQIILETDVDAECPQFESFSIDDQTWHVSAFETGCNSCIRICCWDVWRAEITCKDQWKLHECSESKPYCQSEFLANEIDVVDGAYICLGSSERAEDGVRHMVERGRFYTNDWQKFKAIRKRMMIRNCVDDQWYRVLSVNRGNPPRVCPYINVELVKWQPTTQQPLSNSKEPATSKGYGQWFDTSKESTEKKS